MITRKVPDKGTEDRKIYNSIVHKRYKNKKKDKDNTKSFIINTLGLELMEDFDNVWEMINKQVISEWEEVKDPMAEFS